MATYKTEIASSELKSDNPIHQRLHKAYYLSVPYLKGDLLEIGCGEGRGIEVLLPHISSYTALDKIEAVIEQLGKKFPSEKFICANIPPLLAIDDNSFDTIVSFQVIEHIEDDHLFLKEIRRVLKPGGTAILSTPNIEMSLTRNPWHIREYTMMEFRTLVNKYFDKVEMYGITGNEKVMTYYNKNKNSVRAITALDVFNLQHRLPASWLRFPYETMNRLNRLILSNSNTQLVSEIDTNDFFLQPQSTNSFDLFCVVRK